MSIAKVLNFSCLVTGSIIGAGILALPVKTGLTGFVPSLLGILALWLLMTCTALVIASQKILQRDATADMPTVFGENLGPVGMWVAVGANFIIFYGLMVAYISGAGSVIVNLLDNDMPMWAGMLLFFFPASLLAVFGIQVVAKGNSLLMVVMWAAFIGMLAICLGHVDEKELETMHWNILPATLPVILTACNFHFVIPSLCRGMNHDQAGIRKAIIIGTTIAMLMNVSWVLAVTGVLPLADANGQATPGTLLYTFQNNLPATIPLATILNSKFFAILAPIFALVAICTSYLTCCTALVGFCGDLAGRMGMGGRNWLIWTMSFAPPLAVALIEPNIFLQALDVVGGLGIGLLFGVLPGFLLFRQQRGWKRKAAVVLLCCFGFVILCEVAQELGMMHIDAEVESWVKPPVH